MTEREFAARLIEALGPVADSISRTAEDYSAETYRLHQGCLRLLIAATKQRDRIDRTLKREARRSPTPP